MEREEKDVASGPKSENDHGNGRGLKNDRRKWVASLEYILEYILKNEESEQASHLLDELADRLRDSGLKVPNRVSTPYINTIAAEKEPRYPGNREIERRIKSYVRWNAMAMVVKANRLHPDIGGHMTLRHIRGREPTQRIRTPMSLRFSRRLRTTSRLNPIRKRTSSVLRFQFSVENA